MSPENSIRIASAKYDYHLGNYILEFQSKPSSGCFKTKSIDLFINQDQHCQDQGHIQDYLNAIFVYAYKMSEIKFLFYKSEKDLNIPSMLINIDDFFTAKVKTIG